MRRYVELSGGQRIEKDGSGLPISPFEGFEQRYGHQIRLMRAAVQEAMVELAQAGQLHLTPLLNEPDPRRTLVAMCVLGTYPTAGADNGLQHGRPHEALEAWRVKLRAINGHKLRWKADKIPLQTFAPTSTSAAGSVVRLESPADRYGDEWVDFGDDPECLVSLRDALSALRWCGKGVRIAKGDTRQRRYWHLEEVHPSEWLKVDQPKKAVAR